MPKKTRRPAAVKPPGSPGAWLSSTGRYCYYARMSLEELETVSREVKEDWPIPLGETLRNPAEEYPDLFQRTRKRDSLSDSVIIFSAMAVEAFLNFYGVVRIGQDSYQDLYERLGAIPKLQTLLSICDSLKISKRDPMVNTLRKITVRRNQLVHPKTKETSGYVPGEERPGDTIPETAREAFEDMLDFFDQFREAVPDSAHLIPTEAEKTASDGV